MKLSKLAARKYFLAQRKHLTNLEISSQSQQIAQNLLSYFDLQKMQYVHCFLPIKRQYEVDTWQLIQLLQNEFRQLLLIVPQADATTLQLKSYLLSPTLALTENAWGIPEPTQGEVFSEPTLIDMVITPLLAYDTQGHRVGYGKGFYDRFFTQCRPDVLKVGVSFFEPIESITDTNPQDVRLDYCISPERVWKFI